MNEKITVAFVTNDGYAPYLSTAIYSLIVNRDPEKEYALYAFYSSLSDRSKNLLASLQTGGVAISFVDFGEFTKDYDFYTWAHYTKESYYRLFLPKYFKEQGVGKFIYLDVDLVVNCDIGELLTAADNSRTVWGALNYSTAEDEQYIRSIGLSYRAYINAGVMVIDCKRFNRMGYFEEAIDLIKQKRQFVYIDQDVLNLVCAGDIGIIDPSWNVQWNNMDRPERFISDIRGTITNITKPRIVHFTIDKPWNCMLNRYGEYYTKYAALNPVYNSFRHV